MDNRNFAIFDDYPLFAREFLKIRPKQGGLIPFRFNKPQIILNQQFNEIKQQKGKVRALVLKGRQCGGSTLILGRHFIYTSYRKGIRSFILTHRKEATDGLFQILKTFYENLPNPLKVPLENDNANQLNFAMINSGYKVGTAGSKELGRGQTIQYFHGSEVAFWENSDMHAKGIMEAVPNQSNTEIILESTANGIDNYFYEMWINAERAKNDYKPIFLPWYLLEEYQESIDGFFEPTVEEKELIERYSLSFEQLMFRRKKISNYGKDGEWHFKHEYPFSAIEAFSIPQSMALIEERYILAARRSVATQPNAFIRIGIDPAWEGEDKTVIVKRQGLYVEILSVIETGNTINVYNLIKKVLKPYPNAKIFIDLTGMPGVYDLLKADEDVADRVMGVNFGQKALSPDRYINKRTEMWYKMAEWFYENEGAANIPDDDRLHRELGSIKYKYDSRNRKVLEPKQQLKARLGYSPDFSDALALTFAIPEESAQNSQKLDNKLNFINVQSKQHAFLKTQRWQ